jgi:hypothetical protein
LKEIASSDKELLIEGMAMFIDVDKNDVRKELMIAIRSTIFLFVLGSRLIISSCIKL